MRVAGRRAAATAADAISANGRVDIFCTQMPGSLGTMRICNNLCGADAAVTDTSQQQKHLAPT